MWAHLDDDVSRKNFFLLFHHLIKLNVWEMVKEYLLLKLKCPLACWGENKGWEGH